MVPPETQANNFRLMFPINLCKHRLPTTPIVITGFISNIRHKPTYLLQHNLPRCQHLRIINNKTLLFHNRTRQIFPPFVQIHLFNRRHIGLQIARIKQINSHHPSINQPTIIHNLRLNVHNKINRLQQHHTINPSHHQHQPNSCHFKLVPNLHLIILHLYQTYNISTSIIQSHNQRIFNLLMLSTIHIPIIRHTMMNQIGLISMKTNRLLTGWR